MELGLLDGCHGNLRERPYYCKGLYGDDGGLHKPDPSFLKEGGILGGGRLLDAWKFW